MVETMRSVVQDELGSPDVLHVAPRDRPRPGIGQVLIQVHAAGVNPADLMNRQRGVFSGPPPFTLGWDVSGTVTEVGPGVTLFQPGDEVFGLLPFPNGGGAYAEYVVGPTRAFVRKPEILSHIEAAALPLAGLTAWQALVDTASVGPGTRVLITAAGGGVGHLAVQIAKARGAYVIGLASGESAELARSSGADEVIDYRTTDFTDTVADIDVVLDLVGGDYPKQSLPLLRDGGVFVSSTPMSVETITAAAAERGIRATLIFVESDQVGMTALADLVAHGRLVPSIAKSYPLQDAATAHGTKHGPGKVVLRVV